MDSRQLSEQVDEFNYILAKISKYLKMNQYVYLRAFDSWVDGYNKVAQQLNADKTITVPIFKPSPVDYSSTGKSIKIDSVKKFIKTINHQVGRLEDKIAALNKLAEKKLASAHHLERFFQRDNDGLPVELALTDNRVFVASPEGKSDLKLFQQGVKPALEALDCSFFHANRLLLDDTALCKLCQELYSCQVAIFNLAGQASNVMLALGLTYGIGKPVIILQPQNDAALGELNNEGYLRYAGAADIKENLSAILPQLLKG